MARMTFEAGDEFMLKLSKCAAETDRIAKQAIKEGAAIMCDEIATKLNALPLDTFRYLRDGEKFDGVPELQKKDLEDSLGITPISQDQNGDWNAKIGFDGYGSMPTEKYPQGLPNQLLARAVESGSSVRQKRPFVRPAVNKAKEKAVQRMNGVIEVETNKILGGNK